MSPVTPEPAVVEKIHGELRELFAKFGWNYLSPDEFTKRHAPAVSAQQSSQP